MCEVEVQHQGRQEKSLFSEKRRTSVYSPKLQSTVVGRSTECVAVGWYLFGGCTMHCFFLLAVMYKSVLGAISGRKKKQKHVLPLDWDSARYPCRQRSNNRSLIWRTKRVSEDEQSDRTLREESHRRVQTVGFRPATHLITIRNSQRGETET